MKALNQRYLHPTLKIDSPVLKDKQKCKRFQENSKSCTSGLNFRVNGSQKNIFKEIKRKNKAEGRLPKIKKEDIEVNKENFTGWNLDTNDESLVHRYWEYQNENINDHIFE